MNLGKSPQLEAIGADVVDAAMKVHTALGPGLLESVYEVCLAHELIERRRTVERQRAVPVNYGPNRLETGFRIDLVVDGLVVIEVKAVEKVLQVHVAQVITYLKLGGYQLGYLLSFDVVHMREGVKRLVN